MFFFIFSGCWS